MERQFRRAVGRSLETTVSASKSLPHRLGAADASPRDRTSTEYWAPPVQPDPHSSDRFWVPPRGSSSGRRMSEFSSNAAHSERFSASSSNADFDDHSQGDTNEEVFHSMSRLAPPSGRRMSMQEAIDPSTLNTSIYKQGSVGTNRDQIRQRIANRRLEEEEEDLEPTLQLRLLYRPVEKMLCVSLESARNLHVLNQDAEQVLRPFCALYVSSQRDNTEISRTHDFSGNPEFREDFQFSMELKDLNTETLEIDILNKSHKPNGDRMGYCSIPLNIAARKQGQAVHCTKPILQRDTLRDEATGELMVAINYLAAAQKLQVTVMKARSLKRRNSTTDPKSKSLAGHVRVTLLHNGERTKCKKTEPRKSLEWNETVRFQVDNDTISVCSLQFELLMTSPTGVLPWRPNARHQRLGKAVVGFEADRKELYDIWQDMVERNKSIPPTWLKLVPVD